MNARTHRRLTGGFTIVEIIVVIIVIGILVGLSVISYSLITRNAAEQSLQADLRTAASKLSRYRADHGSFPDALDTAGVESSDSSSFTYVYDTESDLYCLVALRESIGFYITSENSEPQDSTSCPADIIVRADLSQLSVRLQQYHATNNAYPANSNTALLPVMNGYIIASEVYAVSPDASRNLTYCKDATNTNVYALGALSASGKTWVILNGSAPYEFSQGYPTDITSTQWCNLVSAGAFSNSYNGYVASESPAWRTWTGVE